MIEGLDTGRLMEPCTNASIPTFPLCSVRTYWQWYALMISLPGEIRTPGVFQ
ncbi:MAG: hypothetical protein M0Q91_17040 [Methanoregula sp.]|nr:hypothetical protein [Methanoregula sp.]